MIAYGLALIGGYLLGSIPTSLWLGRWFYGRDIREYGSRNAGATNVFRVFGWKLALVVALIDIAKGWLPVWMAARFAPVPETQIIYLQIMAAVTAVLGHSYTVFAQFRGGKGVATAAGALLALHPLITSLSIATFIIVVAISRIVSAASLCAAASLPLGLTVLQLSGETVAPPLLVFAYVVASFIFYTHRANIGRLMRGEERQIRSRAEDAQP